MQHKSITFSFRGITADGEGLHLGTSKKKKKEVQQLSDQIQKSSCGRLSATPSTSYLSQAPCLQALTVP